MLGCSGRRAWATQYYKIGNSVPCKHTRLRNSIRVTPTHRHSHTKPNATHSHKRVGPRYQYHRATLWGCLSPWQRCTWPVTSTSHAWGVFCSRHSQHDADRLIPLQGHAPPHAWLAGHRDPQLPCRLYKSVGSPWPAYPGHRTCCEAALHACFVQRSPHNVSPE